MAIIVPEQGTGNLCISIMPVFSHLWFMLAIKKDWKMCLLSTTVNFMTCNIKYTVAMQTQCPYYMYASTTVN